MSETILGETLITLNEAADDFGGVRIPVPTLVRYINSGYKGVKLESIKINKRYTSKEAIKRFITRKQDADNPPERPRRVDYMTPEQVQEGLRRHKIIK